MWQSDCMMNFVFFDFLVDIIEVVVCMGMKEWCVCIVLVKNLICLVCMVYGICYWLDDIYDVKCMYQQ